MTLGNFTPLYSKQLLFFLAEHDDFFSNQYKYFLAKDMSELFKKTQINDLELSNRFVRSATWEGMADEKGNPTSQLIDLFCRLADGKVGLIITGFSYVDEQGKTAPDQLGIYSDGLISELKRIPEAVHERNGKIVLQIAHGGIFARSKLIAGEKLAPSRIEKGNFSPHRKMTKEDIDEVVESFVEGGRRAKEAGFDGVQLHMAHGYLLSQFLSPIFNKREDDYGGDIENRARISIEILRDLRDEVGDNFPILAKLNCRDFADDGLVLNDSVRVGKMLEREGIDAIEISGGLLINPKMNPSRVGINSQDDEAYFEEEAKSFRKTLDIPLMLVGGIRSFKVADRLVSEDTVDYVSLSRPFIREPDLIKRWKSGDRERATCISCNKCLEISGSGGIYCVVDEEESEQ